MPRLVQITGMTGCGKSHLARALIQNEPRVIVAQPFSKDDYGTMRFAEPRALLEAFKAKRPSRFRVSLAISTPDEFAWLCRFAWVVAPVTLVLDETAPYIPNPNEVPREFRAICQMGRHAGPSEREPVSVIALGQRPVNLPPVFRAEVEHWYLFRLNSQVDRRLLENDMGLTRAQSESAGKLPRFNYMRVDRFGGVEHGQTS